MHTNQYVIIGRCHHRPCCACNPLAVTLCLAQLWVCRLSVISPRRMYALCSQLLMSNAWFDTAHLKRLAPLCSKTPALSAPGHSVSCLLHLLRILPSSLGSSCHSSCSRPVLCTSCSFQHLFFFPAGMSHGDMCMLLLPSLLFVDFFSFFAVMHVLPCQP